MNHNTRGLPRDDILGGSGGRRIIAGESVMRKHLDEVRRGKTLEEAVRLRSKALSLQDVMETDMPKLCSTENSIG